jgi:hypothetical protein
VVAKLRPTATDTDWVAGTPVLDDLQAGSLRRILNLSEQLADDWSGMLGRSTLQEDFGALRFQLAYMAYALALTHVHRLPSAPALFREPFDRLIQKMLSPDVWLYWHYVSTGNGPLNQSLGELPAQWNPVETDNIMYSAYVQSTVLLYHYLFRDRKYAEPGALTFSIDPLFWAMGGKHFAYDENSLNDRLYWSMVERGYLGVACEPNCIFQVCNQPPILGFRFHDLVYGGSTAEEVTQGYLKAWQEFGILNDAGHFNMMVQEKERTVVTPPNAPWVDFWMASLMHAWNPDFVKRHYPQQLARWSVDGPDGTLWIKPGVSLSSGGPPRTSARDFGWAAVCAAEVGDAESLSRMLAYADRYLHPVWADGAYFYRRHDEWFAEDGTLSAMDPHTSNALLPYARLNVPDGLRKLYDGPWGDAHFAEPALVRMTPSLDIRRAWFDAGRNALALTVRPLQPITTAQLTISNALDRGAVQMFRDGQLYDNYEHAENGHLVVTLDLKGETTLVAVWS